MEAETQKQAEEKRLEEELKQAEARKQAESSEHRSPALLPPPQPAAPNTSVPPRRVAATTAGGEKIRLKGPEDPIHISATTPKNGRAAAPRAAQQQPLTGFGFTGATRPTQDSRPSIGSQLWCWG
ncbi:hypothetical protein B0H65DRAFT_551817 [Neurospora tetraspora]|uniref:Uncharacterized protein n=1 Tax=Neurospora tetraspora TaxID=94610 RepID=A0AAE0J9D6_9PEZI|nr:hypothetical protein B0H65DRAFT_551817 [Neurospora tetraspora]